MHCYAYWSCVHSFCPLCGIPGMFRLPKTATHIMAARRIRRAPAQACASERLRVIDVSHPPYHLRVRYPLCCLHPRLCLRSQQNRASGTTLRDSAGHAATTTTRRLRRPRTRIPSRASTTLLGTATCRCVRRSARMRRRLTLRSRDGRGAPARCCSSRTGNPRSSTSEYVGMLTRTVLRRLLGFGACLIGAAVCFFVAFLTLPWIALRPAKFALAFRYGDAQNCSDPQAADDWCSTQLGELARDVWVRLGRLPGPAGDLCFHFAQIRGPHRSAKSPQASLLERAATILLRVPRELGPHTVFLPWGRYHSIFYSLRCA